ncbi:hypothetical protein VM98_37580, partial [Streptomyces rubellomurinus subsp. indigoferus]
RIEDATVLGSGRHGVRIGDGANTYLGVVLLRGGQGCGLSVGTEGLATLPDVAAAEKDLDCASLERRRELTATPARLHANRCHRIHLLPGARGPLNSHRRNRTTGHGS